MKWSLFLGRIAGIKIYLHWTFVILLSWILVSQWRQGNSLAEIAYALVFILVVFACVFLHELGHALMARRFKITTKDITLLPIGGLARLKRIPENPREELWVALAGPAVNVAISIIVGVYLLLKPVPLVPDLTTLTLISLDGFLVNLFLVNLLLAGFNMIPAFPMDGGRVFRALLALKLPRLQATKIAAALGQIIAIMLAFLGLMYNPILLLIAIFVYLGAQFEANFVEQKSLLHPYTVRDIMMRQYHKLNASDPLTEAVKLLLDTQDKDFIVMDQGALYGVVSVKQIIKALQEMGEQAQVGEIMQAEFSSLHPEQSLDEVYEQMQTQKISMWPVIEHGALVGILNLDNLSEFIMIRNVLPDIKSPALSMS